MIRLVSQIGEAANILVDKGRKKYASAHDLRRSFGERWAARVMPQVLMELMRHESIDTTLKYYVGRNAQRTTKLVREAYKKAQEEAKSDQPRTDPSQERDSLRDSKPTDGKPSNEDAT